MKSTKLEEAFSQPDTVGTLTASITDRLKKQINYAIKNEKLDLLQSALQLITKLLGEQDIVSTKSDKTQLSETETDSSDITEESDILPQEEDSKEKLPTEEKPIDSNNKSEEQKEKEAGDMTNKIIHDAMYDSNQTYAFLKNYFAQIDEDYQGLISINKNRNEK